MVKCQIFSMCQQTCRLVPNTCRIALFPCAQALDPASVASLCERQIHCLPGPVVVNTCHLFKLHKPRQLRSPLTHLRQSSLQEGIATHCMGARNEMACCHGAVLRWCLDGARLAPPAGPPPCAARRLETRKQFENDVKLKVRAAVFFQHRSLPMARVPPESPARASICRRQSL